MSDVRISRAIILAFLLFFSMIIAGWVASVCNPAFGEGLLKLFEKEVAGNLEGATPAEQCLKIFINNFAACILLFLGGASFGILTIFIMSLNGIVIGAIIEIIHESHSLLYVAAALLPHGIFEIPAFIVSGALGILLAQSLIAELHSTRDAAAEAGRFSRMFIRCVLPLIAIAACVEAFITPVVLHLVA
jgi:stage II sporulation protein M